MAKEYPIHNLNPSKIDMEGGKLESVRGIALKYRQDYCGMRQSISGDSMSVIVSDDVPSFHVRAGRFLKTLRGHRFCVV